MPCHAISYQDGDGEGHAALPRGAEGRPDQGVEDGLLFVDSSRKDLWVNRVSVTWGPTTSST